jgi:hypothetical protein
MDMGITLSFNLLYPLPFPSLPASLQCVFML